MKVDKPVLIGSTFPLGLIRRRVTIAPADLGEVKRSLRERGFVSFWGHANTLAAAAAILGTDVSPETGRPAISLDTKGFPCLGGVSFSECFVLSPDYRPGFRPAVGEEVSPDRIAGWQVLRLVWLGGDT